MMLITEKDPNIKSPEKRVNSFIPVNSKLSKSIKPKMAQNNVWEVSQRLKVKIIIKIKKVIRKSMENEIEHHKSGEVSKKAKHYYQSQMAVSDSDIKIP